MLASRRRFLENAVAFTAAACVSPGLLASEMAAKPFFEISLAEWSLHKALFSKQISNLDFPVIARKQYGIGAVEYVNQFFKDKAKDQKYLSELLQRCRDNGVKNHLIMIDGEGDLGAPDATERAKTIENHYQWVDAAHYLGCASIRVNAYGKGSMEDVQQAAADSLSKLGEYAQKANLNVIVENHGSYSSNGEWLLATIKKANRRNVGILPDFGNFCVKRATGDLYRGNCLEEYDKYKAVQQWMPVAKGVSAKTLDFDATGNCLETDYNKMFQLIKASGFKGYVGIEYEGEKLSEEEGIRKTKALLERVAKTLG
ncbi:sugar phosphate isomerase/epimerase [Hymenobacter sp. BT186]|uniref:Sugar phosphate isomerase/epimerase n=1 Tax=Hymenobacter telluris TaxID=2816474 RepID=A0A939EUC8_9BACT|nr:sugar phosphate isomerase/epimerase family protein [Hymenobacter telluris]MBO0357989.1 sugar phosphate isomerase/epimerase [Hymenobacter telluris]MBW3374016.1 sugar phosphate isomerase/epimerase [Hymenobacter norwichensis]